MNLISSILGRAIVLTLAVMGAVQIYDVVSTWKNSYEKNLLGDSSRK